MAEPYPDLQIQRYLEGSLPLYDEDLLFRALRRGGALADRFVELRELECGLAEYFGRRCGVARAAVIAGGFDREGDSFHARRFPASGPTCLQEDCAVVVLEAYERWLRSTEIVAHRKAVVHCMGLILEQPREVLRCRHRLGMSSRRIAESFSHPLGEVEELVRRVHTFLAGCVRMRLARTG
jgi:hypothetical protein